MHVFFESVWKLHIGEIPEKPPFHFNPEIAEKAGVRYNEAIAAIKQNALTVGNPEAIERIYHGCPISDDQGFIKWYGGYETIKCSTCGKEWNDETSWYCSNSFHLKAPAVATLTPPHEKTLNA